MLQSFLHNNYPAQRAPVFAGLFVRDGPPEEPESPLWHPSTKEAPCAPASVAQPWTAVPASSQQVTTALQQVAASSQQVTTWRQQRRLASQRCISWRRRRLAS